MIHSGVRACAYDVPNKFKPEIVLLLKALWSQFTHQPSMILGNAACVAYAYSSNFTYTKVYTETGAEITDRDDVDSEEEEDGDDQDLDDLRDGVINSRDPMKWINLISTEQGKIPKRVIKYVQSIAHSISDPREGTIDAHLKLTAQTLGAQ
ncbi:hypothetical protein ACJJTC_002077 [Scirpophaga incertulas]